jgi:hypothetical protein
LNRPDQRSANRSTAPRGVLLLPVLAALLAALPTACGPVPTLPTAGGDQGSPGSPATSGTEPAAADADREAAVEAVVLIRDNKERCLKIAREGSRIYETAESLLYPEKGYESYDESPRGKLRSYLETEAAGDTAIVAAVEPLVQQSIARLDAANQGELTGQIRSLFQAQQQICRSVIKKSATTLAEYRREITPGLYAFTQAEQRLGARFKLTAEEKQRVLSQHRAALVQVATTLGVTYEPMPDGGSLLEAAPQRAKSAEEYRQERLEYEEKLRRREEMQSVHQRSIEQWRNRERKDDGMPKVGLASSSTVVPATSLRKPAAPPSPLQAAMESWHKDYALKAYPAKLAINRFHQAYDSAGGDPLFLQPACQNLKGACDQLLATPGVLAAPDTQVKRDLEQAFSRYQAMAIACIDGQKQEATRQVAPARDALARANAMIKGYGLRP